jgi:E3 ubiquitin-protein ligase RNF25
MYNLLINFPSSFVYSGVPELIETTVFPTVGENFDQQYVCLTLLVIPGPGYPDEMPTFKLRNPRGLSDSSIATIEKAVVEKLIESLGQPVVFDLIEVILFFFIHSFKIFNIL